MTKKKFGFQNVPVKNEPSAISDTEIERRRRLVREAHHENLLEGHPRTREFQEIYQSYIRGEISAEDVLPRIKNVLGLEKL